MFLKHAACLNPLCGSSDAMAIYRDEVGGTNGYCWSCSTYFPRIVSQEKEEESGEDYIDTNYFESISKLPTRGDPSRQLEQWAMSYYGVRTELSTTDGQTVVAHYYPYTRNGDVVAFKSRKLPKELTTVGEWKNVELFGQHKAKHSGGKKLFICEGEVDCISLYQVLKSKAKGSQWESLEPSVVSICTGAASAVKDISRNINFVKQFEQIVLVFDQDKAGKEAVEDILKLLPGAVVAKFAEKDVNDMLMKGKSNDLWRACLFNAQKYKPASVVSVDDVFEKAIAKPEMGLTWPWKTLTDLTYGIHRKRIYSLGSGVGMGKSDATKEIQAHLIKNYDLPQGVFSFEEDTGILLKGLASKIDRRFYHKPDEPVPEEEIREAIDRLRGKVLMFDHQGTRDWDDVKAAVRYMVVDGIKDIWIDPLTALVSHLSSGEANDMLNTILSDLAAMVHELDFSVYLTSHLNPPQSGPPHERNGKVVEQQFTGSRAVMRWSHLVLGLEGTKDPDVTDLERNSRRLVILKERSFGHVGTVNLFYDNKTSGLTELTLFGGGMY